MYRQVIYMLIYLCHLCAYVFMSLICSSMQCLTVHTICKKLSPQYYSRFHDPSRDLKVTCQSTPFKRGSVSPYSAHSLKQWKNKNKNTALVQLYWEFAKLKALYALMRHLCAYIQINRLLCIDETFMCLYTYVTCVLMYLCHLYARLCNAWQLTKYAKNTPSQYYSRFHDPSRKYRDLKATCQSTPFKRGSVSPSSAHSLRIHAMKEHEQEHCISTTVLTVCKNKRLLCIDKTFNWLYTYVTCVLMYLCHLYAHLCNA